MTQYFDLIQHILDASNRGLGIITDCCPAAAEVVNNPKKAFRLRPDERTPSAYLYPPKDSGDCWHVKDYGMCDGGGYFSPIDLYMRERGYVQSQFSLAIHELAERYGVEEALQKSVNKPNIEQRPALPEEIGQPPIVVVRDGFTDEELRTWGPCVKPEHLTELGWQAVVSVKSTKDGKTTIKKSTPTYPIFVQNCAYTKTDGIPGSFQKLYEPKNYDKRFRFSSIGEKPSDYVFGLNALRSKFIANNEEKLDMVIVVSGGSDAVNCRSMGYQPVWLNSETANLSETTFRTLQSYAKRIVLIADNDETGRENARQLALRYPQLYIIWFTATDMGGLHDSRHGLRKDLKDYILLHHNKRDMEKLMKRAKKSQFADYQTNKNGKGSYTISETALTYFLWLNGYSQIKDVNEPKPQYIHEKNGIVSHVAAKDIHNFLKEWCEHEGVSELLQNTLMKSCRSMITDSTGHLTMRDDMDFSSATATSQAVYFSNCKATVTADGISHQPYSAYTGGRYVWEDSVIHHTYRSFKPMFTWEKNEEGRYIITFADDAPSKLMQVIRNIARLHWRKKDELGLELTAEEAAEEMQALVVILLTIGYLLHRYKSPSAAYAPLLLDNAISNSPKDRNGRSGKSFLMNAVGVLLHKLYKDMRKELKKSNQQFSLSGVKESIGLIIIDECPEDFAFETLYSMITDDLEVERKKENSFIIPFSKSPKFVVATNNTLKDHSPSTEGRFAPVVVSDYYHVKTPKNDYCETRQISDTFGMDLLKYDYPENDFQADIFFMLECLQMFLSLPEKDRRQMPPMARIERRELQAAIGDKIREWFDENLAEDSDFLDRKVCSTTLYNAYIQDTRSTMSPKTFTERLKEWCRYAEHINCYNPASETNQKKDGDRWQLREGEKRVNYYYIQTVKTFEEAKLKNAHQEELPF
jgi:hypothetical protein